MTEEKFSALLRAWDRKRRRPVLTAAVVVDEDYLRPVEDGESGQKSLSAQLRRREAQHG